jgi:hypothetical protein
MAIATTTTLAYFIKDVVSPEWSNQVNDRVNFLKLFLNEPGSPFAGTSYKLIARSAVGTTPAAVTEDSNTYPTATAATWVEPSFTYQRVYGTYALTDHAKAALGVGMSNSHTPGLAEAQAVLGDSIKVYEDLFHADSAAGLLGQVDDDTTAWGGVSRATDICRSYVLAGGSTANTLARMSTLKSQIESNGGVADLIISGSYQRNYYKDTLVLAATQMNLVPAGLVDAVGGDLVSYAGIPWVHAIGFAAAEIAMLSGVTDGSGVAYVDHVLDLGVDGIDYTTLQLGRCVVGLSHEQIARTAPESTGVWGLCGALIVKDPIRMAKAELLATS